VFTARYALIPYIKQIRFVFKGLIYGLSRVRLRVGPVEVRVIIFLEKMTVQNFLRVFPVLFRPWNSGLFEVSRQRLKQTSQHGCEDSKTPHCLSDNVTFMAHCIVNVQLIRSIVSKYLN
jgi:hypothetical protein